MSFTSNSTLTGIPSQQNWFARNWKWLVPALAAMLVLLAVSFAGGVAALVFGSIKSIEPYKHAVFEATHDQRALKALGAPVQAKWLVSGSFNLNGPSGDTKLSIPVQGSSHSGTIYVVASKSADKWSYQTLELAVDGQPNRIDFLNQDLGGARH